MAKDWRPARVIEHREVARGSMWITLEAVDGKDAHYEPGHVLSLALRDDDGSYAHHAYTVSTADPDRNRFAHLYRVIPDGELTPRLNALQPGDEVYFHGRAHTPIQKEVKPEADRIVGIATGTGIGPLYGYAKKTLAEGETRPLTLYVGMRQEADMCLRDELTQMTARHPNFSYAFSLTEPGPDWTGLTGRVTESVPPLLTAIHATHFHLVGNGAMIDAFKKALRGAGLERKRVTLEYYFNFDVKASPEEIDAIRALLGEQVQPPDPAPDPVAT